MDRRDEYQELLQELENTPVALEYTVARAEAKVRSKHRRLFIAIPLSSVATFLVVFVILMNTSVSFAYACGRIPFIKDLAKFVAFSPSLSTAVENEFVQPIGLQQSNNNVTAKVEYLIVDQKQLNIFYSLSSNVYSALDAYTQFKSTDENQLSGVCILTNSFNSQNGDLRRITVEFIESNIPDSILLTLDVYDIESYWREEPIPAEDSHIGTDENQNQNERRFISSFTFKIDFDPNFIVQGETIIVNKDFKINGQSFKATTVDIYPTYMSIEIDDDTNNTAWLMSLDYYLEDDNGKKYAKSSHGVSATGKVDSPMMASYRTDSPYFSKYKSLTFNITGVTWLDKNMERVKIDIKNKTAEALPQDVVFENAVRKGNNWLLTFSGKMYSENSSHQLWNTNYYDEEGNEYRYSNWSMITGGYYHDEGEGEPIEIIDRFYVNFTLEDFPYDTVYLAPAYSSIVKLSEPIEIKIK